MIHIWAPHPDDEIIGCHEVLSRNIGSCTVHYLTRFDKDPGIHVAKEKLSFEAREFIENHWADNNFVSRIGVIHTYRNSVVYAPDPQYDNHPDHQYMGHLAIKLFRSGIIKRLILYSTRMNSPYIWELPDPQAKLKALNTCYPDKSSLWKYDHRFFLFEGMVEWLRPGA